MVEPVLGQVVRLPAVPGTHHQLYSYVISAPSVPTRYRLSPSSDPSCYADHGNQMAALPMDAVLALFLALPAEPTIVFWRSFLPVHHVFSHPRGALHQRTTSLQFFTVPDVALRSVLPAFIEVPLGATAGHVGSFDFEVGVLKRYPWGDPDQSPGRVSCSGQVKRVNGSYSIIPFSQVRAIQMLDLKALEHNYIVAQCRVSYETVRNSPNTPTRAFLPRRGRF